MKHIVRGAIIVLLSCLSFQCEDVTADIADYYRNGDGYIPKLVSFTITAGDLEIPCNIRDGIVTGVLPYGMSRKNLISTYEITEESWLYINDDRQESGVSAYDYNEDVEIVVKDVGGEVSFYTVKITNALNDEASLFALTLTVGDKQYVCLVDNKTLFAYVPYGTDMRNVGLNYVISEQAGVSLNNAAFANGSVADLSNDITLKVSAQDSRFEKDYRVIVKYEKNTRAELTSFQLNTTNEIYNCPINGAEIKTDVAYGTNLTNIIPKFSTSYGAKLYDATGTEIISGETAITFTKGEVMYFNVVSEDGAITTGYSLMINELPNHEAKIIQYSAHVGGATYAGTIEATTITVSMPAKINLDSITDSYTLSPGAYFSVSGSQLRDDDNDKFVIKRFYRVTSADNAESRDYIINIMVLKNTETSLDNFTTVFGGSYSACTGPDATNVISCVSPWKANMASGFANFTAPYGASVKVNGVEQVSGVTENNFSGPIVYTVISENPAHSATYTVNTRLGCYHEMSGGQTIAETTAPTSIGTIPTNYGIGRFHSSDKQLTDDCGYELLYPNNPGYEYPINDLMYPYDGLLPNDNRIGGQSMRIKVNNANVRNMGFDVVAKNLSLDLQTPPANQIYLDPENSKFIMPGPVFLHTFDNADSYYNTLGGTNFYWTPSITVGPTLSLINSGAIYNKAIGGAVRSVETVMYPFGNDAGSGVQLPNGAMAIDLGRIIDMRDSPGRTGTSDIVIALDDATTRTGFSIRSSRTLEWGVYGNVPTEGSIQLNRYGPGWGGLYASVTGLTSFSDVSEKLYITWNSTGRIEIYSNGISRIVCPGGSDTVQTPKISITLTSKVNSLDTQTYNYVQTAVTTLKIWREYFPQDYSWIEQAPNETSVHPVYGAANGYGIDNITVSYFYNE